MKSSNISNIFCNFYNNFYFLIFYKKDFNYKLKSTPIKMLFFKNIEIMIINQNIFQHNSKLLKQYYNSYIMFKSYVLS